MLTDLLNKKKDNLGTLDLTEDFQELKKRLKTAEDKIQEEIDKTEDSLETATINKITSNKIKTTDIEAVNFTVDNLIAPLIKADIVDAGTLKLKGMVFAESLGNAERIGNPANSLILATKKRPLWNTKQLAILEDLISYGVYFDGSFEETEQTYIDWTVNNDPEQHGHYIIDLSNRKVIIKQINDSGDACTNKYMPFLQSMLNYRTADAQDVIDNNIKAEIGVERNRITTVENEKLGDVPADGRVYVRRNGEWLETEHTQGMEDKLKRKFLLKNKEGTESDYTLDYDDKGRVIYNDKPIETGDDPDKKLLVNRKYIKDRLKLTKSTSIPINKCVPKMDYIHSSNQKWIRGLSEHYYTHRFWQYGAYFETMNYAYGFLEANCQIANEKTQECYLANFAAPDTNGDSTWTIGGITSPEAYTPEELANDEQIIYMQYNNKNNASTNSKTCNIAAFKKGEFLGLVEGGNKKTWGCSEHYVQMSMKGPKKHKVVVTQVSQTAKDMLIVGIDENGDKGPLKSIYVPIDSTYLGTYGSVARGDDTLWLGAVDGDSGNKLGVVSFKNNIPEYRSVVIRDALDSGVTIPSLNRKGASNGWLETSDGNVWMVCCNKSESVGYLVKCDNKLPIGKEAIGWKFNESGLGGDRWGSNGTLYECGDYVYMFGGPFVDSDHYYRINKNGLQPLEKIDTFGKFSGRWGGLGQTLISEGNIWLFNGKASDKVMCIKPDGTRLDKEIGTGNANTWCAPLYFENNQPWNSFSCYGGIVLAENDIGIAFDNTSKLYVKIKGTEISPAYPTNISGRDQSYSRCWTVGNYVYLSNYTYGDGKSRGNFCWKIGDGLEEMTIQPTYAGIMEQHRHSIICIVYNHTANIAAGWKLCSKQWDFRKHKYLRLFPKTYNNAKADLRFYKLKPNPNEIENLGGLNLVDGDEVISSVNI